MRNLAGAEVANIPAALNVYTAASGQSRLITEGDFTFIYIPAEGEEEPFAALVSYGGSASVVTLPSGFTAQDGQVTSYEIFAGRVCGKGDLRRGGALFRGDRHRRLCVLPHADDAHLIQRRK